VAFCYDNLMKNKSFTLIELLVVIAVIGLLASIVIVNLTGTRSKANIARGLQFSQSVHHALGAYAVGVWSFDEGSGTTANDASGYGNNGTINGASYTTDTPSGQGYSLSFDGVDDYVDVPTASVLNFSNNGTFAISIWVKPDTLISAWRRGILRQENYLISGYRFGFSNGGTPIFWTTQSGGTLQLTSSAGLTVSQWNHIVVTYNNQQAYIYLNGIQKGSATGTYIAGSNAFRIGYLINEYFNGLIDEVRIYERALETAQIEELYYAGLDSLLAKGLINKQEYHERLALKY